MKKHLIKWQTLMATAMLCLCALTLSSCGDDNDNEPSNGEQAQTQSFYGDWYLSRTSRDARFKDVIEMSLYSQGKKASFVYSEVYANGDIEYVYDMPDAHYLYDESTKLLKIFTDYSSVEMTVSSIEKDSLRVIWYTNERVFTRGKFDWSKSTEGLTRTF